MAWLPDGEKVLKIRLFVLTQSTNILDGQTHRHRMTAKAKTCAYLEVGFVSSRLINLQRNM